jgi:hypothetical protein
MVLLGIACSAHAAECAPPDAIDAYESGRLHLESGHLDKGISDLELAVAIYPDFGDAWYDLYDSYKRAGRPDDEIRALEQLVRINPGRYSGAEIWRELLALHRAEATIPSAAADALNRCRLLKPGSKRAIAECKAALSLHADYADAHYFLGVNFVHAGEEELAKEQLAALLALDPTLAGMLAHAMDELTTWMTEDYRQELGTMFAATPVSPVPETPNEALPAEFSDEDVARILSAYEQQIDALRSLIADPNSLPKACERKAPAELQNQLKETLIPLSFVRIKVSHKPDCHGLWYSLLDASHPSDRGQGVSEVVKVANDLQIGDRGRERWRVGLYQKWVAERYCKAECTASLEFRIDTAINGRSFTFTAWVRILEEVADIGRCSSHFGETPGAKDW